MIRITKSRVLCYNIAGDTMKKIILLLCMISCVLCGCQKRELTKYSDQILDAGFDTFIQLIAYTEDEETFQTYLQKTNETFLYYNKLFDRYHTYEGFANIKTINDQAGKKPVKVNQEIIDVLLLAKEYSEQSSGQYDVTYGAVLEIWHQYREDAINNGKSAIPSIAELNEAKQHTGWDKIEIDEQAQTVYINDPLASLDMGSVAKGYASEQCAKELMETGLEHAIINAGGNVRIIGNKADDSRWSVGIQLPSSEKTASLATIYIDKDKSFVTSGDYQRAYEYEGKMYHHIIDPKTLMPAAYMRSVTVITNDSGLADILSTTLFAMSYEDGCVYLEKLKQTGIVAEAVWVFDETTSMPEQVDLAKSGQYRLAFTDGLKDMIDIQP